MSPPGEKIPSPSGEDFSKKLMSRIWFNDYKKRIFP
jgi:hypothetical protein